MDDMDALKAENERLRMRLEELLEVQHPLPPPPLVSFDEVAVQNFERQCQRMTLVEAGCWFVEDVLNANVSDDVVGRVATALRNAGYIANGLGHQKAAIMNFRVSYDLHEAIQDVRGVVAAGLALVKEDVRRFRWSTAHARLRSLLDKAVKAEHHQSIDLLTLVLSRQSLVYFEYHFSCFFRSTHPRDLLDIDDEHGLHDGLSDEPAKTALEDLVLALKIRHRWSLHDDDVLNDLLALLKFLESERPRSSASNGLPSLLRNQLGADACERAMLDIATVAVDLAELKEDRYYLLRFTRGLGTCLLRAGRTHEAERILRWHLELVKAMEKPLPPWFERHGLHLGLERWYLPVDDRSDPGIG